MNKKDCWIIIPAHNERRHIAKVVEEIRKQKFPNIVVVDDGSKDNTAELARKAGATVLTHMINMHKGAAMLTGSEYAVKQGAKALIYLDGDGQHDPKELPRFLEQLNKDFDIVFGARRETRKMPIVRRLGKISVRATIRILFKVGLHDCLSGYRALTVQAYQKVKWTSNGYTVECEMIANAGRARLRCAEITISTIYHDKYKGVTFIDGIFILFKLVWWKLTR